MNRRADKSKFQLSSKTFCCCAASCRKIARKLTTSENFRNKSAVNVWNLRKDSSHQNCASLRIITGQRAFAHRRALARKRMDVSTSSFAQALQDSATRSEL